MGKLISVAVRLRIPLQFVSFIVYLASSAFNVTGTIPFELKRLPFPLHPITSLYIAVRYTHRHLIHMNSPVPRFGLDSVHGRACQGHIEPRDPPARSGQTLRRNLVGLILTYTRAEKELVCFILEPI
jgi:hypothetical protein